MGEGGREKEREGGRGRGREGGREGGGRGSIQKSIPNELHSPSLSTTFSEEQLVASTLCGEGGREGGRGGGRKGDKGDSTHYMHMVHVRGMHRKMPPAVVPGQLAVSIS